MATTTSLRITQDRINSYASCVQDFNPIHVDPAFAATTPYGGTIAHGTISAALVLRHVIRGLGESRALTELSVKYVAPTRAGDELVCEADLLDDGTETGLIVYQLRCLRSDGTVVTVGRAQFVDRSAEA